MKTRIKDQTIFSGCLCLSCDHLNHMDCIRANCKCCVMDATQYKKVIKKIKIKSKITLDKPKSNWYSKAVIKTDIEDDNERSMHNLRETKP